MEYHKPEIVTLGAASSVIQGMPKSGGGFEIAPNQTYHVLTVNAYEADE